MLDEKLVVNVLSIMKLNSYIKQTIRIILMILLLHKAQLFYQTVETLLHILFYAEAIAVNKCIKVLKTVEGM